jgi:hypothetical protein
MRFFLFQQRTEIGAFVLGIVLIAIGFVSVPVMIVDRSVTK